MKKDLPWFRHYNSTHNEPRMQALLAEYGFEGYGRFWILYEKIAASPSASLDISSRIIKLTVARDLGLDVEKFEGFIEFLSAFDINLIGFNNCIITSDQIQEDYIQVCNKRQANKDSYQKSEKPIQTSEKPIQTSENIQSRVDQNSSDQSRVVQSSEQQTTTTDFINIDNFIEASKEAGFIIDRKAAGKVLAIENVRPSWFDNQFNFAKYAALRIKDDPRYANKPDQELKRLFLSSLTWEDYQQDFLKWRQEKHDEIERKTEQRRVEKARADKPTVCTNCETVLEHGVEWGSCPACSYRCYFDEKTTTYKFDPPIDFKSMYEQHRKDSNSTRVEEIDF